MRRKYLTAEEKVQAQQDYQKSYYQANNEKIKENARDYYNRNKDRVRQSYLERKEDILRKAKERYHAKKASLKSQAVCT